MMKRLFTALLFGAALVLGSAELPLLSPAPVIDGKKGDPGWKNAFTAPFKIKHGKIFLGRSATHLYVAVEVRHGNIEAAANNFVRHDSAVYADDCLDFFFTGAPGSETYSQIIANVRVRKNTHSSSSVKRFIQIFLLSLRKSLKKLELKLEQKFLVTFKEADHQLVKIESKRLDLASLRSKQFLMVKPVFV